MHEHIIEPNVSDKKSQVYRGATDVAGMVSPWNFPLCLTQRSVTPVLALNNTVMVKPAGDMSVCDGLLLARIFEGVELLAGLFSMVAGPGSEIGGTLAEHPISDLVTFTGPTPVDCDIGHIASGGAHFEHVALELDGDNPFVALNDTSLEQMANVVAFGRFLYRGQVYMTINHTIVEDSLYDVLTARFVEWVKGPRVGDP